MAGVVIFTDLDGTLLHDKTYSFEAARSALETVRQRRIPVVLVSSKTSAEIEEVRRRLDNEHPFVSENGGGVIVPEGYFPFAVDGELRGHYRVISLGSSYAVVRKAFLDLREKLHASVRGFGDMSAEEVAALTGLSSGEAALARRREFDEPFVFTGPPDTRFLAAIEQAGLHWTRGRIHHIMGDSDKGKAVRLLREYFDRALGPVTAIGLGDGLNDLPLLQAVDHPVLVRRSDGSLDAEVRVDGLFRTEGVGPAGWGEAIHALLSKVS